jgi:hypothetical protein
LPNENKDVFPTQKPVTDNNFKLFLPPSFSPSSIYNIIFK